MRKFRSASKTFGVHAARLREPLVQVWLMAGTGFILVIMGHVRAVRQSGDWKNPDTSAPFQLLTAGASLQWTDDFAIPQTSAPRPSLVLNLSRPTAPLAANRVMPDPVSSLDWRGEMETAARGSWEFLLKKDRAEIDLVQLPATGLEVRLAWTGDHRGNAALHRLDCQRRGVADESSFVIGNGSRSGNGSLEITGGLQKGKVTVMSLIGTPETTTTAQKAALGELLNYLEARFGTLDCHDL